MTDLATFNTLSLDAQVEELHSDACIAFETAVQIAEQDELTARATDSVTIPHSLTKKQRARLRAYFATNNVETTKNARYSTRAIPRAAYEFAMSA